MIDLDRERKLWVDYPADLEERLKFASTLVDNADEMISRSGRNSSGVYILETLYKAGLQISAMLAFNEIKFVLIFLID